MNTSVNEALAVTTQLSVTEQTIAQIWSEILQVEHPGLEENFFDLGGHSLVAIRIAARVRTRFGVNIPLSAILENPTISDLAKVVDRGRGGQEREEGTALVQTPSHDTQSGPRKRLELLQRDPLETQIGPMSGAQHQLWTIDQLTPGNHSYNISQSWRLKGKLDVAAFEWSLGETVKRHEALRTTFRLVDGEPAQVIEPPFTVRLQVNDVGHLPEAARELAYREFALEQSRLPFDLAVGPLSRFHLVRFTELEHALLLVIHHIVFDEASAEILITDILKQYARYLDGHLGPLPEAEFQYRDYSAWQQELYAGTALRPQLDFWKRQLENAPLSSQFPLDHLRLAESDVSASVVSELLPLSLLRALEAIGRQQSATAFMVLLAAFEVLLHRYTGLDDLIVGLAITNRRHAAADRMIGPLINTIALRTDVSGNPKFRDLVARVRGRVSEAYDHPDVPFQEVVRELGIAPDQTRNPLFQVMFLQQQAAGQPIEIGELSVRPDELDLTSSSKFDLTVYVRKQQDGSRVVFEYDSQLFDRETVSRLLVHYRAILEGVAANADRPIGAFPLLTDAERKKILREWNNTSVQHPSRGLAVHQMFEAQVQRTPDKTAVVCEKEHLTYWELNARVNQLAHYLRSKGVGPEVLVGICLDRSIEMLVGLLGTLKAGGAYLPLDPGYPEQRRAFLLEDSGTRLLLTQERTEWDCSRLPIESVCLDREWPVISQESNQNPVCRTKPEELAYVIYTSGSTGYPKGVQITHRSLTNLLSSVVVEPGITGQDVMISLTTISFDIAGLELFAPLITGAKVVVVSREDASDGEAISQCLERNDGTVMQATPATWRLLLQSGWTGKSNLKVLCGGETITRDLAEALLERSGSVWNLYGPTETTIWSTVHRVEHGRGTVPIGRPIANTDVYILDAHMELVPIGVVGELLIGGDGLARGYLNRRELTAERFVAHPFRPGSRLYRTGDLARFRRDGSLECLGRVDQQVKIRGRRIELGEIEMCLRRHGGVRDAAVDVREHLSGEKRLVAYLVPRQPTLNPAELSSFLGRELPDYMVPTAYMMLPSLPQTQNGKLDRKALALLKEMATVRSPSPVAPRTPTEQQLVQIWSRVLEIPPPDIRANFFELGGHSVHAARLFAKIANQFNVKLSLNSLLQSPTIEDLAAVVDKPLSEMTPHRLVPIQSRGTKNPLFWIPGGRAISVLAFREVSLLLGPDQPVYGLESQLPGKGAQFATVAERAAQYIKLIRSRQAHGPYNLAGFCLGGMVAFEMARQLMEQGAQVGLLALIQANTPGFPASPVARLQLTAQRRLVFLKVFAQFAWMRICPAFMSLPRQDRQRILDRVSKLLLGWVATSSELPDETQSANVQAMRAYCPRLYPGSAHLFLAEDCYESAGISPALDPRRGWRKLVKGQCEVHLVPGDHFSMLSGERAHAFAEKLKSCMRAHIGREILPNPYPGCPTKRHALRQPR